MEFKYLRIGTDFDGCIADTGKSIIKVCSKYFDTEIKESDLFTYYFNNLFGVDRKTEKELVNRIVSREVTLQSPIIDGVKEVLEKWWSEDRFLYIITAREDIKIVKDYMEKNFSENGYKYRYNTIILSCGSYEKGNMCSEFKLNLFVEDYIGSLREFVMNGVIPIILKQAWNKYDMPSPDSILGSIVKYANNWKEVGQIINIYKRIVEVDVK
jgi:uncharacterized HAD superfamily protein